MGATETHLKIRPVWCLGRAAVIESPVDETAHPSGLLVPLHYDGDGDVKRGVLIDATCAPYPEPTFTVTPGSVVYYRGGVRIGDVTIVDLSDVIAWEDTGA